MQLHLKAITAEVRDISSVVSEGTPRGMGRFKYTTRIRTRQISNKKIISSLIILQGGEHERLGRDNKLNRQISCSRLCPDTGQQLLNYSCAHLRNQALLKLWSNFKSQKLNFKDLRNQIIWLGDSYKPKKEKDCFNNLVNMLLLLLLILLLCFLNSFAITTSVHRSLSSTRGHSFSFLHCPFLNIWWQSYF